MTDEISNPFVNAERSALLLARSFAMMAMDNLTPGDEEAFQATVDLGVEIQHALMMHRALFGRVCDPIPEA